MAAESLVGESVRAPARYYRANLVGSLGLVDAMLDHGVRWIVFSSSAAVYGEPERQPIEESAPAAPTNPYGETKLAFERALGWYGAAYGIRSVSLRYFNAAGATERSGERHDPETHLIPLALDAAAGRRDAVTVLGDDYPTPDGTCIRDYVHVSDLARAHVLALEALAASRCEGTFNLGCGGTGTSVREVIEAARKVTGRDVPVRIGTRRPGDPPRLVAATDQARRTLGWTPRVTNIEDIIDSAWRWQRGRARGI
jgi:UDP-glucose 4-epimerase